MRTIVTGKEMKYLDENTSGYYGIPEIVLMEQAANSLVEQLAKEQIELKKVLVVSGCGNNGADGIAIARLLNQRGIEANVFFVSDKKGTKSYELQKAVYLRYNYGVETYLDQIVLNSYSVVIDAIFGIGLSRDVAGEYVNLIQLLNTSMGVRVAVDIPSGISADTGAVLGEAFQADITFTFAFGKIGQYLYPGTSYCGKLVICKMGINECSWLDRKPNIFMLEKSDLDRLPKRIAHSNKGTYGKLLVVAGGEDMCGAAYFSVKAAYKAGVGMVKVFTGEKNRIALQSLIPEVILETYSDFQSEKIDDAMEWADCVVLGPGIGKSAESVEIVRYLLENSEIPLLIDADALNIIAENDFSLKNVKSDVIITPHLGEMSRLTGKRISTIQGELLQIAIDFSKENELVCVLKDFRTVISSVEGEVYINLSGNNGMATAGSGDVLAGIIGALFAQGAEALEAATLGVYIHGVAGDLQIRETGTHGLIASELIEGLNLVWNQVE